MYVYIDFFCRAYKSFFCRFVSLYKINLLKNIYCSRSILQARQTRPNSGGVAKGHPRFDKGGGGCNIFFTFYALKIELFRVFTLSD